MNLAFCFSIRYLPSRLTWFTAFETTIRGNGGKRLVGQLPETFFIRLGDPFPAVQPLGPRPRGGSHFEQRGPLRKRAGEGLVRAEPEVTDGVAADFPVLRRVEGHDAAARGH